MRFAGRLYHGKVTDFLALYSHYKDIYFDCPDSIKEKAKRTAHVIYHWKGFTRSIDVFQLANNLNPEEIPEIKLNPSIYLDRRGLRNTDNRQGIKYQVKKGAPKEVLDLIRRDIKQFIKSKKGNPTAKESFNSQIDYVNKITAVTETKLINPWKKRILTPGKHEFVPECGNIANIDFSKGCITSLVVGDTYNLSPKIVKGVFVAPWLECDYCYAGMKHKSFLKNVYKFDWNQLKEELLGKARLITGSDKEHEKPIKRLRFGKRTETGSQFTRNQFMKTLEVCIETNTQGVIPTKFLEYNKEVAKLLKKTNSNVIYSIGWDEFQKGAVSFGCTTEWELEQATKYGEAGVNVSLYLMLESPVMAPSSRDLRLIDFVKKNKKNLIGVQLLPMRYWSKDLIKRMAGLNWDHVKNNRPLLEKMGDGIDNSYETISGQLNPLKINPFWLDLIKNNNGFYRMCHHTNDTTWCGGCFTKKGIITKHPRVKVNRINNKIRGEKKKAKKKPKDKNQKKLIFPK